MCLEQPPSPESSSGPFWINYPVPTPTQATNLRVKKPSWIQVLTFSHAIRHLHGSPLCSYLPTSDQLLCLGKGHSPSWASHSHIPPALPCSHEVNLFCSQASPRATHPAHLAPAHLTMLLAPPQLLPSNPYWFPSPGALTPAIPSYHLLPRPCLDLFYLNFSGVAS